MMVLQFAEGLTDRQAADAVAALSPYMTTHLTRFGRYSLDLARVPAAIEYNLPILSTPSGREGPGVMPR